MSDSGRWGRQAFRRVISEAAGMSPLDLALRLTLLDLLLRPVGDWMLRPFTLSLAALGLLIPGLFRAPFLWLSLAYFTGARVLLDWPLPDNHAYLLFYWCLAVTIALFLSNSEKCLSFNGRLLIGLAFAFSVLWKLVLSHDFMNGTFFKVTMLTDYRFEGFTRLVTGLTHENYIALKDFLTFHTDGPLPPGEQGAPPIPERLVLTSRILTYWTILIEGAVAVFFLMPARVAISRLRDYILVIFCLTTYAVANVDGFGWLLIATGVSQADRDRKTVRFLYLAAFVLIIFYGYFTISRFL